MNIETTSSRCYYDQDGNHVHVIWASEQHMPRLSATFHGGRGYVTIAYDLVFTGKRLSREGRALIHTIFQGASGEHHHDSSVFGLCAGAEEGEDQHISFDQADAVAKVVAGILKTHMISLKAWQQEGKAH